STWHAYFQGEPEAALGHARQALEIAERIGSSFSRALAWLWLGVAERMRGEWRRAIEAIERSLAIVREGRTGVEWEAWRLALREAHCLFTEIGASGHAERLAGELAMPAS